MGPLPSPRRWTRRAFVTQSAIGAALAEHTKGAAFPSEWRKFSDPATEFEAIRLTDPAHSSLLPAYYGRFLSRRGQFLLFSNDRTGTMQPFRMDLKTGESHELAETAALDPRSLTLLPDERGYCCFDGAVLRAVQFTGIKQREVYRTPEGFTRGVGFSVAQDGVTAFCIERRDESWRLRMIGLGASASKARAAATTLAEAAEEISNPEPRPRRSQVLYRKGEELWLVDWDGRQNRRLKTAEGGVGPVRWSPDGKTLLYLHFPADVSQLHAIRELTPDLNQDRMVSKTSQFAHFGVNGDASVFVGASQNRNSPHILILLRQSRRELTVCEHKASDPRIVMPAFSPDSQRIFFASDKHGKPAIYRVQVERFVEKTEEETD